MLLHRHGIFSGGGGGAGSVVIAVFFLMFVCVANL